MILKQCSRCKQEKSLDEFSNQKGKTFGKRSHCKICQSIEGLNYRRNNKNRLIVKGQEYWLKNSKRLKQQHKEYYQDNKEVYYQAVAKRRALKLGANRNDFTNQQWSEVLRENDFKCFYCGIEALTLTQDHKIPLSRGGDHTKDNIVPACKSDNSKKNAKTVEEYLALLSKETN